MEAAAAEVLTRETVDVTYRTDAQRNVAAPPDGTTAYTLEDRTTHVRQAGAWVVIGEAAAPATPVLLQQGVGLQPGQAGVFVPDAGAIDDGGIRGFTDGAGRKQRRVWSGPVRASWAGQRTIQRMHGLLQATRDTGAGDLELEPLEYPMGGVNWGQTGSAGVRVRGVPGRTVLRWDSGTDLAHYLGFLGPMVFENLIFDYDLKTVTSQAAMYLERCAPVLMCDVEFRRFRGPNPALLVYNTALTLIRPRFVDIHAVHALAIDSSLNCHIEGGEWSNINGNGLSFLSPGGHRRTSHSVVRANFQGVTNTWGGSGQTGNAVLCFQQGGVTVRDLMTDGTEYSGFRASESDDNALDGFAILNSNKNPVGDHEGNGNAGVTVEFNSKRNRIVNGSIEHCQSGVTVTNANTGTRDNVAENLYVLDADQSAFYFEGDIQFSNLRYDAAPVGVWLGYGGFRMSVQGRGVRGRDSAGIRNVRGVYVDQSIYTVARDAATAAGATAEQAAAAGNAALAEIALTDIQVKVNNPAQAFKMHEFGVEQAGELHAAILQQWLRTF